ncbi:IS110 family transposase [Mesorhizobium mediterraneum]|uniref:IS110 family transposase n=1 Tax=Mesorhizobium TaxID=68287 RepID=UPI001FD9ADFC|nr:MULTISPECIES: IS110 family transposase [Mesorhizobium]WIW55444.1 IS110 family transposase [Mesorhizobium mediterraneum]
MRIIGLDIHRAFAEAVAWEDGRLRRLGRVDMRRDLLAAFAAKLSPNDVGVIEATGNATSATAVVAPHVKKVGIGNPKQVRIIAYAKIKTTIEADVLAQLYASGFLPEVWIADEPTQALRRQVTRRNQIVRQRSRLKTVIQSILHSHLIPSCPHADLCGAKGRTWLIEQVVPQDERLAIDRHLREFDRLGEDLQVIERDLARSALEDEGVKRLMTIPGVDITVALAMKAAIGDVSRFDDPQKLVTYLGLNPSVRQSGQVRPTMGGSPSRAVVMRAACSSRRPGRPLVLPDRCEPSPCGVRARRGQHVAAVATARKLSVVIWHLLMKGESFAWARPSLHAKKLARCGTQGREQGCARPKGSRARLQHKEPPGRRAPLGGAGRGRLCTPRRRLEPTRSEEGRHGCRKRGATIEAARQGSHLGPCSSPRGRPCATGE